GGEVELVSTAGTELWGGMPTGDVRTAVIAVDTDRRGALEELLESETRRTPSSLFFGAVDGELLAVATPAALPLLRRLAATFDARIGLSAPGGLDELARSRAQAQRALAAASVIEGSGGSVVDFETVAAGGVLASLGATDAAEIARAGLAPLALHDAENGTALIVTLRAWLENDAQFDAAAQALGVHRHTVRNRIAVAERVLGRDLSTFPARAELWAALVASG
ncbi:MAG: helix-turn-helix domain-containing protein, partial [Leifsonia flava]